MYMIIVHWIIKWHACVTTVQFCLDIFNAKYFHLHVIVASHLICPHGFMAELVTLFLDLTIQLVKI